MSNSFKKLTFAEFLQREDSTIVFDANNAQRIARDINQGFHDGYYKNHGDDTLRIDRFLELYETKNEWRSRRS